MRSNFFLMSTAMLVCPVGIVFLLSLLSFRLPVWCSSDPPGTPTKPAVFYTIEDVAAVDFKHGRDFRAAIHARCAFIVRMLFVHASLIAHPIVPITGGTRLHPFEE